jgi:hypothetical protein
VLSPLHRELYIARTLAEAPDISACLSKFGLPNDGPRLWGLADVEIDAEFYQPVPFPIGVPALIAAAYEGSMETGLGIVDLVAISLRGRHAMRTRRGVATFLGGNNVEMAIDEDWPLFLYENGFSWIRNRCRGAVVLDWRRAPHRLAHVRAISCETPALAKRLRLAFERPLPLPDLFVPPTEETSLAA